MHLQIFCYQFFLFTAEHNHLNRITLTYSSAQNVMNNYMNKTGLKKNTTCKAEIRKNK